jgi:hypothetical protein
MRNAPTGAARGPSFSLGALRSGVKFDPTKPWGPGQQAPLAAEYRKVLEDSMADQAKGGIGNYPSTTFRAGGMPRMMSGGEFEYVVTPETTYVLLGNDDHYRRIFTDGRDWPEAIEPTYQSYSVGKWVDEDGVGRYDVLEVETRGFKGPRAYDGQGCRCTSTISRYSRSASISTRPIRSFSMTR